MKKRSYVALHAMAIAGLCLAAVPVFAIDPWSVEQFNQIQARTIGQGYAVGLARTFGNVHQTDVAVNSSRGIGFGFSNTNVFGSSEAAGMAASVNGMSSLNVISAQNISSLAGNIRVIVR
ncbi:MAG: hypothetical protein HGB02_00215 [Chlorobiaceae bacterium]|nr:hypothetical protein [Chlorobiaceae bacterium]